MSGLFDGVTGLLSSTFGGPVDWCPVDFPAQAVCSIFRRVPVELTTGNGEPVLAMQPIWRVARGALPRDPLAGDLIVAPDSRTYRVTAVQEGASSAADRFLTCELELVT